jgi:uncharacterized membrane protein YdbT with pleckstrin-like domain
MSAEKFALIPGETTIIKEKPHWWFFWRSVAGLAVVIGLLLAGGLANKVPWLDWLTAAVVWLSALLGISLFFWAAFQFIQWRSTIFMVTSKRVIFEGGLLRKYGMAIPLDRINNVGFTQSLLERILGNGTIKVESAGEDGEAVFTNISNPARVRQTISLAIEADQTRGAQLAADLSAQAMRGALGPAEASSVEQPVPATAASLASDVTARLAALEGLLHSEVISEAEYDEKRRDILGSL